MKQSHNISFNKDGLEIKAPKEELLKQDIENHQAMINSELFKRPSNIAPGLLPETMKDLFEAGDNESYNVIVNSNR